MIALLAGCALEAVEGACVPAWRADLGAEGARWMARTGEAPDVVLAFDATGERLAVGTAVGDVLLYDVATGQLRASVAATPGLIRWLLWVGDDVVLGTQAPEAELQVRSGVDLAERKRVSGTELVGAGAAPGADNPWAAYAAPAAYDVAWTGDGLWVLWGHPGAAPRMRVVQYDTVTLVVKTLWPADGPSSEIGVALSADANGASVAVRGGAVGDGVLLVDEAGVDVRTLIPPLAPWYDRVTVWDAVVRQRQATWLGLADGRLVTSDGRSVALGTPTMAGDVPVAAPIAWLVGDGDGALAVTSRTSVPYGSASGVDRPADVHAAENHLWRLDASLAVQVSWTGPPSLGRPIPLPDGGVVVGLGPRVGDARTDLFGALFFDRRLRPVRFCPTIGPVDGAIAHSTEGDVAVVSSPTGGAAWELAVFR